MLHELTNMESKTAENLKEEFKRVRDQITDVENEMERLSIKAGTLIKELEGLRDDERTFLDSLDEKYGEGKLNPFNLIFETDD